MKTRYNWMESISAFAVGVGVGAALGMLFAPRSGSDTREYLVESAQENIDQVKSQVRQAADVGERAYREAVKNTTA